MLKKISAKSYFLFVYLLVCSLQLFAALNHQLFGDEAFYWLEGQNLAWSYSEVPGWTPWTLAFTDWLFPQQPIFIRIPSLLAAFSLPWLAIWVAHGLRTKKSPDWLVGLLMLALPVLGVAGTLAIPDIWMVFFTLLAFGYLIRTIKSHKTTDFIFLGLILALGINVHLRFWLLVLITCAVVFWLLRAHKPFIIRLLSLTLPMMLLGFIPVLLFNLQHDFALLEFQLKDRHPWQFQSSHVVFFLIQIVITTPWVFYLCLKNLNAAKQLKNSDKQIFLIKVFIFTAVIHWLVYAVLGFFSDNLRLNVHWTLITYVLLLLITTVNNKLSTRMKRWAVVTGLTANLWLLMTLSYWLVWQSPISSANAQMTNNASGWQLLSSHTDNLMRKENTHNLVVDHFMSLAELMFYSKSNLDIKALPHPLNNKHGRAKQLAIMGLMHQNNNKPQILMVEHSALKPAELIAFYQSACKQLNGIQLIDSLDINQGLKTYHYFKTGQNQLNGLNEHCEIPPIIYYQHRDNIISGWILQAKNQALQVTLYDASHQVELANKIELKPQALGQNPLFANLNIDHYQLLEFQLIADPTTHNITQLKIEQANHPTIFSQRLLLDH